MQRSEVQVQSAAVVHGTTAWRAQIPSNPPERMLLQRASSAKHSAIHSSLVRHAWQGAAPESQGGSGLHKLAGNGTHWWPVALTFNPSGSDW